MENVTTLKLKVNQVQDRARNELRKIIAEREENLLEPAKRAIAFRDSSIRLAKGYAEQVVRDAEQNNNRMFSIKRPAPTLEQVLKDELPSFASDETIMKATPEQLAKDWAEGTYTGLYLVSSVYALHELEKSPRHKALEKIAKIPFEFSAADIFVSLSDLEYLGYV